MGFQRGKIVIDCDAVRNNISQIRDAVGERIKVIAVIKADAYGHGAVTIGRLLEEEELVYGFAVATGDEAVELRENGIKSPILILGTTFPDDDEAVIKNDIATVMYTVEQAKRVAECVRSINWAGSNAKARVHIAVDTGMSRIGLTPDEEGLEIVKEISKIPEIEIEGVMTHFAKADEIDKSAAKRQYEKFTHFIDICEKAGIGFKIRHCSNSASIMELEDARLDAVRAGIILYGLRPSFEMKWDAFDFQPVMSIESTVAYVKTLKAGTAISYGGTYVTDKDTLVATIPIGYADGYPRGLSNKGYVLIRGKRAPILGRVCMDQMMVDVTDIDGVKAGDKVTLLGRDGTECIMADDMGEMSGRFNYELVCDFPGRLKRVYERRNKN